MTQLILLLFTLLPIATTAAECDESRLQNHRIQELGQRAAALFREAETELATDMHFRGSYKRVISPEHADKLRATADELEQIPGDHAEYAAVFRELADVLAGERSIKAYSRKFEIGYVPPAPPPPREIAPPQYWADLSDLRKFEPLSNNILLRRKSVATLPVNLELEELLRHAIGDGVAERDEERSTEIYTVYKLKILALDGHEVRAIEGDRLVHNGTHETKFVINSVRTPHMSEHAAYYHAMARQSGSRTIWLTLPRRILGRDKLVIPGRTRFKIEHKHRLPIHKVISALMRTDHLDAAYDDSGETNCRVITEIDGQVARVVLKKSMDDTWILKTAHFDLPQAEPEGDD